MTFMRKFMDMLKLSNHNIGKVHNSQRHSTSILNNTPPKWLSVRDDKAMEVERKTLDLKNITIFFDNGVISDVVPDVYSYYEAQYYNIDGIVYDSYSIESIKKIPIPNYSKVKLTGTPVYSLDYLLNIRASQERRKKNNQLAYVLLEKSLELMKHSQSLHNEKQITRIVNWLYEDGKLVEAEDKKIKLQKDFPYAFNRTLLHKEIFEKQLRLCKELGTDYIYCSCHHGTCPECAKYQCRVYCISGKDKRLPKLPDIVKQYGGFHEGCRHTFHAFFLNTFSTIQDSDLHEHDVYRYSNRPFIDDRTESDKQMHLERLEKKAKEKESAYNKEIYYLLKEKIPDIMPKSLSGFTRMKNINSKNYQAIVQAAQEIGIEIN